MNPPHIAVRTKITGSGIVYQTHLVDKFGTSHRVRPVKDIYGRVHHVRIGAHKPKTMAVTSGQGAASKEKTMRGISSALRGLGISQF